MFLWLPLVIGPAGYTPEATLTGWWLQSQPRSSVFSWVAVSPHRTGVVQGLGRDVGRQNPGWFPPLPLLPFWDSHLSLPCLQLPWLGTLVLGFFFLPASCTCHFAYCQVRSGRNREVSLRESPLENVDCPSDSPFILLSSSSCFFHIMSRLKVICGGVLPISS